MSEMKPTLPIELSTSDLPLDEDREERIRNMAKLSPDERARRVKEFIELNAFAAHALAIRSPTPKIEAKAMDNIEKSRAGVDAINARLGTTPDDLEDTPTTSSK
jgi:hypothetical protein